MKTLLLPLAASLVFAKDLGVISPRYDCPMHDIAFFDPDLDLFEDIGSWQTCGTYLFKLFSKNWTFHLLLSFTAHICNSVSICKFWTWVQWINNGTCALKASDDGIAGEGGCISGQKGCTG